MTVRVDARPGYDGASDDFIAWFDGAPVFMRKPDPLPGTP